VATAPRRPPEDRRASSPLLDLLGKIVSGVMIVPVVAAFATAVALIVYGAIDTYRFILDVFFSGHDVDRNHVLLLSIEIVDLFLLATVVHVVSLGLFQLYFRQDLHLPKWLIIESLDDLKSKLVGVAITVLAVYFLGQVVSNGIQSGPNILYLGGAVGVVIAALTYFLTRIDKD
jgi:uncharacterized membrane protein YqhA